MLLGRVVSFGIKANHKPEVCDESRLSQGLKDKMTDYVRGLNVKASETSLTSPGDLGLCVFGLTRTSDLNEESLDSNSPTSDGNGVVIGYIREMDTNNNN